MLDAAASFSRPARRLGTAAAARRTPMRRRHPCDYGAGNGGLAFSRTEAVKDVPRLASVDTIMKYSLTDGGGVGLMIATTPAPGVDAAAAARDLAVWVAQHAFASDGTLRNDHGNVRPEITLTVGDRTYQSSYTQMVDLADGRLTPGEWIAATAQ